MIRVFGSIFPTVDNYCPIITSYHTRLHPQHFPFPFRQSPCFCTVSMASRMTSQIPSDVIAEHSTYDAAPNLSANSAASLKDTFGCGSIWNEKKISFEQHFSIKQISVEDDNDDDDGRSVSPRWRRTYFYNGSNITIDIKAFPQTMSTQQSIDTMCVKGMVTDHS